jgi:peptidoglycan biosynthesis protein MviN/MurJ (putative lipid II flippase)
MMPVPISTTCESLTYDHECQAVLITSYNVKNAKIFRSHGSCDAVQSYLGMVREMVYARFMGDGLVASAFFYAFQIPNLFRRLLGEGALTAAFIPMFKEKEMQEGEKAMWHVANATISALIVACSIAVTLIIVFSTAMIEGVKSWYLKADYSSVFFASWLLMS